MTEAPLMLGVSGLRGIVGKSLTPEVAARFAGAFATWLNERDTAGTAVVGRDGRAGGEAIHHAVVEGLTACGVCVVDIGVAMTPTVGVMTDAMKADGAMVVTASHNPQEWNGLKCLIRTLSDADGKPIEGPNSAAPSASVAREIIELFQSGRTWPGHGAGGKVKGSRRIDPHELHVNLAIEGLRQVGAPVPLQRPFRIVLDSVNASGGVAGAAILKHLGCVVTHLGSEASGIFPHPPEPVRENLGTLCDAVKTGGSDVGFAQDPDADRLAVVDERGEYIGEEYTLVLAAEALLTSEEGTEASRHRGIEDRVLVTNLSTSRMIDDVAARHGARVIRTAVGEANVVEVMKREAAAGRDVVVGGEGNGGVIWPRVTYVRDSLSAMGLVLGLMARRKQKLSEIVAGMPSYAIEKRKVELARREDAKPAVEKVAAFYGRAPGGRTDGAPVPPDRGGSIRIDRQDGVRVDFDDRKAWLHVRASNTEPIMRLIAEAPTAEEARRVLEEAERVIGK